MAMLSSRVDAGSQLSSNARTKITATMQAKRLLRGQWRPALMLATVMSALTVFWVRQSARKSGQVLITNL